MGLMDELRNIPDKALGGTGKTFIDADTLKDDVTGETYRLQGYNAAEVDKILGGKVKEGTAGGAQTTDAIHKLANDQGFTNIVHSGEKGAFGRGLVDLQDKDGRSFSNELIKAGAFDVNKFSTEQEIAARDLAEAERNRDRVAGDYTNTAFDDAAAMIERAEMSEGAKLAGFRINAGDPFQYNQILGQLMHADPSLSRDDAKKKATAFLAPGLSTSVAGISQTGESLNPFSDSWDQGWKNLESGAYGVMSILGTKTGIEQLENIGEDGIAKNNAELGQYGSTVLDYKEVDGVGAAFEYLGNNLALSLPQMGATAIATVAAPFTAGLSLTVPAAIYAGQVWNEMEGPNETKSATIAIGAGIAQGTLDMLGLKLATKGLGGDAILKKAVSELVKKGATKEAAEQTVAQASRRQIAEFTGAAAEHAKKQLAAKQLGQNLMKAVGTGGVGEAGTEALQESIGYSAALLGSEGKSLADWDWEDYNNRIIAAAIAGGSLGGAISSGGTFADAGKWADVAYRLAPADATKAAESEHLLAREKANNNGRVRSTEEIAADAGARAKSQPSGFTLDDRVSTYKAARKQKSTFDKVTEEALNVSQLWQGATRNIFTPDLKRRSQAATALADMFGGSLSKTHSGASFENAKHHRVSVYKNMVPEPRSFYQAISGKVRVGRNDKAQISDTFYNAMQKAVDKNGNFDANLVPDGKNKQAIVKMANEMNALSDRMFKDQAKHNPKLGYVKNYLSKYKSINKGALNSNKSGFIAALEKNGYKRDEAHKLLETILENDNVADIGEAFSVVKGGISPQSHQQRNLNMSEKPEFADFMEKDMFANIAQATKSAARYTAHRDFIGENGGVVAKLLDDMEAEGVPQAEVDKVASQMKDYLDAESGNYKRATTKAGKDAQKFQRNFMMLSTLSALPLATISSLVETMLINRGLRADQIFGKEGSLRQTGSELANTLWNGIADVTGNTVVKEKGLNNRQEILKKHGFYDWDVGAATVTGATEVTPWQQDIYEGFFKYTGLTGFTNFTRAARAGIAGDYINDKLETIFNERYSGADRTRETQEAEEQLSNLGIDVDQMVDVYEKVTAGIPLE